MTLARARIIKAARPASSVATAVTVPRARVLRHAVLEAEQKAHAIVQQALQRAREIHADAERDARHLQLQAASEGRAQAAAELAAQHLALAEERAQLDANQSARALQLARLLAEQWLGEALTLDPALAGRSVVRTLQQLRASEAPRVRVHPGDQDAVTAELRRAGIEAQLDSDAGLQPGELQVDTALGRLELRLQPGLDRLTAHLRTLLSMTDLDDRSHR